MRHIVHKIRKHVNSLFRALFAKRRIIKLGIYGEPNTGKTTLANKISMDWLGEPVGTVSDMPHETRTIQKKEHIEVSVGSKKLVMNLLDMPGLATKVDYTQFMKYTDKFEENPVKLKDLTVANLRKIAKHLEVSATGKKTTLANRLKKEVSDKELPDLLKELKIKTKPRKRKKATGKDKKKLELKSKEIAQEATEGIVEAIKWLDNVDTVLVMMDSTKDPLTQVNLMLIGNLEAKDIPIVIVANKADLEKAASQKIKNAFPQHPVISISALKGKNLDELYHAIAEHSD